MKPGEPETITAAEYQRQAGSAKRPWSNARKSACPCGRTHPSRLERTVCVRLTHEAKRDGARLLQQVRFPLLAIASKPNGTAHTVTVDFVVVASDGTWRAIDAKARSRISRDWPLRSAAFAASYGRTIEEVAA